MYLYNIKPLEKKRKIKNATRLRVAGCVLDRRNHPPEKAQPSTFQKRNLQPATLFPNPPTAPEGSRANCVHKDIDLVWKRLSSEKAA